MLGFAKFGVFFKKKYDLKIFVIISKFYSLYMKEKILKFFLLTVSSKKKY